MKKFWVCFVIALLSICSGCSGTIESRWETVDINSNGEHWEVEVTKGTFYRFSNGFIAASIPLENGDTGVVLGTPTTSNKVLVEEYSRSSFNGEFVGYTTFSHYLIFKNKAGEYTAAKFLKNTQVIMNFSGINDPSDPVIYPTDSWAA